MGLLDTIKDKAKQVYSQGLLNQVITNPASVGQEISQIFDPNYMRQVKPMSQEAALDVALSSPMMALTTKPVQTSYEIAHEIAQKNAALPVSKGGLGLPKNNTAMDRARAMGFYTPSFRAVNDDITYFRPSEMGTYGGGVYSAKSPEIAEGYYDELSGSNLMPLLINTGKNKSFDSFSDYVAQKTNKRLTNQYKDDLAKEGYDSLSVKFFKDGDVREYNNFNPSDLRSINAAFDPFRRNEADILAGTIAAPIGLLNVDKQKKKK